MSKIVAILIAALASLVAGRAFAQANDLYKGKQISLIVNFTAGGPTDTEARLLARHLSDHIRGRPPITVRNLGGAGGMIGVNWLGRLAQPDGMTLGYFTALAGAAAEGNSALKVDPSRLPFIAGVESLEVYYARSDLGGGLRSPEDLMHKRGFWVGGLNPDSQKDIQLRAEMDLLGLSYRYISGYPGAAEARLALQQNEIQLTSESLPSYRTSIEPGLIKTGKAIPLWYDTSNKYSKTGDPDAKGIDVLPFELFYRKVKGAPPENELWRMRRIVVEGSTSLVRTIHFPPGTPEAYVAVLRQAVAETQRDPAYRADAMRTIKYVPRFSIGSQAEQQYRAIVDIDPQMRKFIQNYVAKGVTEIGK